MSVKYGNGILPWSHPSDKMPWVRRRKDYAFISIASLALFFSNTIPLSSLRFIQDTGHGGGCTYHARNTIFSCSLLLNPKVTRSKVSFSPGTLEETQRNFRYCFILQKNTFLEKKAMEVSNHQVCPFLFNREYLWAKLDYGTMCLHHLWMCHCMQLCFWNSMNK